jgi:ferredoxin
MALNVELSQKWPVITEMKAPPDDADDWKEISGKLDHLQR